MSWDSHWKFGHALCCSQIRATTAEWRSETKSCWCEQRACQPCKYWWKLFKYLFLFTKLKSILKGQQFESVKEIKENSLAELCSIPKEAFHKCFKNWKKHCKRCIKSGGKYFKGNKAQQLQSKWENDLFNFSEFLWTDCVHLHFLVYEPPWTHEKDTKCSPQMVLVVLRTLNMCVLEFCVVSVVW